MIKQSNKDSTFGGVEFVSIWLRQGIIDFGWRYLAKCETYGESAILRTSDNWSEIIPVCTSRGRKGQTYAYNVNL